MESDSSVASRVSRRRSSPKAALLTFSKMPRKWKADDEGFQHPNAKKSKPAEESSEELYPRKWQDFGWERPVTFLTHNKFKFPPFIIQELNL
jgi:hypothetical protein